MQSLSNNAYAHGAVFPSAADVHETYDLTWESEPMKKILMGTTALAAIATLAAAPANAADPIQISVNGYMEQYMGWAGNDDEVGDTQDVNIQSDTEIHFNGRTTLDNGITFGVRVELEGNTAGDQIDESYLFIQGGFGRIILGEEDAASDLMHVSPPDVGISTDDGDIGQWLQNNIGVGGDTSPDLFGDAQKLTYFTPRFAGLQFGVSYVPEGPEASSQTTGIGRQDINGHDGVGVGLNYTQDFGGFNIAASATFGYLNTANDVADETNNDFQLTYAGGLNVGFGPITVGASYGSLARTGNGLGDGYAVSGGVAYKNGPIGVSANGVYANSDQVADQFGERSQSIETSVNGRYTLGPGVAAVTSVGWASYDTEFGGGQNNSGVFAVGGFRLDF